MPRRRRNEDVFNLLDAKPWRSGFVFACLVYLGMKYGLPWLAGDHLIFSSFAAAFSHAAGYFAAPFFILAGLLFVASFARRDLLDRQTGLDSIRALSWQEFEILCGEAFRRQGYAVKENGLGGADGGVDLLIRKKGQTHLVQCKHWKKQKVGVKDVRELFGIVTAQRAASGILISTGHFTVDARAFAEGKPLDLINGPALVDFIGSLKPTQESVSANPNPRPQVYSPKPASPSCPRCGGSTQLKIAQRGQYKGQQFWGCTQFPQCRGLVNLN